MKIGCALSECHPAVFELIRQEGFPIVGSRLEDLSQGSPSVVFVGRVPRGEECSVLRAYLRGGGAVVGSAEDLSELLNIPVREERVRFLRDDRDERPWFDLIDLDRRCFIPREANAFRTDENTAAAFIGEWMGGVVGMLPFRIEDIIASGRAVVRQFASPYDRLPYERVSATSLNEVRHALHRLLEDLHHRRGIPYVRAGLFPEGWESALALRLDTDRARPDHIEAFWTLSEDMGMPFTWFVDTGSHVEWLNVFHEMSGQEIGIHCFGHQEFRTAAECSADISRARNLLLAAGVRTQSYAAPYGVWSSSTGEAVEETGMEYSSEFGAGYDGVPFYPFAGGESFRTLQVPVHPISPGALRRSGYTHERMEKYFFEVVRRKRQRGEPVFLYDHPVHECSDVIRSVLEVALDLGARRWTLGEYAAWWRHRLEFVDSMHVSLVGGDIVMMSDHPAETGQWGELSTPRGVCTLRPGVPLSLENADVVEFSHYSSIDRVQRIRESDLRTELGTAIVNLIRRFD